jgi:hypothetical protein
MKFLSCAWRLTIRNLPRWTSGNVKLLLPPRQSRGAPADARAGGLLSFNAKIADEFNRAASYVDRILRGAKPADLPVQFPVKFEMVLNAKTAMAAGITFPETLKAIADEVIE